MVLTGREEMLIGVVVKVWCCVLKVSLVVLSKAETDMYHHPVTLASWGMVLISCALAASGGRL